MAATKRSCSKEEFARRGDEFYEKKIRPKLRTKDEGKFAAIDIETGIFEIDEDELAACDRLRSRAAQAQIWIVRVGSRSVHRFGGHVRRRAQ